ncbi:MAG: insulinase family protein [Bacteroidota bacterium]
MKKFIPPLLLIVLLTCTARLQAQLKPNPLPPVKNLPDVTSMVPKLETVPGDPMNVRLYTLANGLKVYMTVYKNAPRIYTAIAVRAGSKFDPANATGLAHYLEHMLFKGTSSYGTLDYSKEKPLLDQIEILYEKYRQTSDEAMRKKIYRMIDSISGIAAKYAIANEYDKMLASIGAKGTNAFTSNEQTVYINDIPSNQLEKWLTIEAERFMNPVFRIFHTELEAVYEEKNISLDSDGNKLWESLYSGLFPTHPYGTQTTIGTIEHLKNPSLMEIKNYFKKYYVPGNIAICISGDFDPDATIAWINQKFGGWGRKPVAPYDPPKEKPLTAPVVKEVWGPDAETMAMAFRLPQAGSKDADLLTLVDKILYNGTAGLIDLNLVQSQKVLRAYSYADILQDYSAHILMADPKEGQKMEDLRDLLLAQLDKIKKGEFPDWLLGAIINNMKLDETKEMENNSSRVFKMVNSFILGEKWEHSVARIARLSQITKQEIIDFVKKNYGDNYVVVYKRTGEDKNVMKVTKPEITPVEVNRDSQSEFVKKVLAMPVKDIEPVFIDFSTDIQQLKIRNTIPLYYTQNKENNTFNLYYVFEMGSNHDRKLNMAINYLKYLGTSLYKPDELKSEFYKLACDFGIYTSTEEVYVSLSGLSDNMEKALQLFESLLADPQPNEEALKNLVSDELKNRADAKLNQDVILWQAMYNYGIYGPKNPFTHILSEAELKALKAQELIAIIKGLNGYEHHILLYGPQSAEAVAEVLTREHKTPATLKPVPEPVKFEELPTGSTAVYVVNYDMKQAEIMMLSRGDVFNKEWSASVRLYNEYFGGGMSSIVFQDLRESKALAYSTFSSFSTPDKKHKHYYNMAYIGTQADKLPEAMKGMNELLNNMPLTEVAFTSAKEAIIQSMRTTRVTRTEILFTYERARKLGLGYDVRKDVYSKVLTMTLEDVKKFQEKNIKGKNYTILVLGDKNAINMKTLELYGAVKVLSLQDIFGY